MMNDENDEGEKLGLVGLFDRVVALRGDDVALVSSSGADEVGLAALRAASVAVAVELTRRHGVGRGDPVLVVSNGPSAGEAAAVLGCARARAPFVPAASDGVAGERTRTIVEETAPAAVVLVWDDDSDDDAIRREDALDEHPVVRSLERTCGTHRIVSVRASDGSVVRPLLAALEADWDDDDDEDEDDDPLYYMYTSGTTDAGRPKAVVQTHRATLHRLRWQWSTSPFFQSSREELGYGEAVARYEADGVVPRPDAVLRRTPLAFVDSVAELFGALCAGVPLWTHDGNVVEALTTPVNTNTDDAELVLPTRATLLPSQLSSVLTRLEETKDDDALFHHLHTVIVSGEPCDPRLVRRFVRVKTRTSSPTTTASVLINLYGQTETAGDVLCAVLASTGRGWTRCPRLEDYRCDVRDGDDDDDDWIVPAGRPIGDHVMSLAPSTASRDGRRAVTFRGVARAVGRLVVSGPGVARGYWRREEDTKRLFLGSSTFDTSDLAFRDAETDSWYVVGRDGQSLETNGHATWAKVNGVAVHAAELERAFADALRRAREKETEPVTNEEPRKSTAKTKRDRNAGSDESKTDANSETNTDTKSDTNNDDKETKREQSTETRSTDPVVRETSVVGSLVRTANGTKTVVFVEEGTGTRTDDDHHHRHHRDKVVVVVGDHVTDGVLREARRRTRTRAGDAHLVPHLALRVAVLPRRGAAGKVDRDALAAAARAWFDGDGSSPSPGNSARDSVRRAYAAVLGRDVEDDSVSLADAGGDSLAAVALAHRLNESSSSSSSPLAAVDVWTRSRSEIRELLTTKRGGGEEEETIPPPPAKKKQRTLPQDPPSPALPSGDAAVITKDRAPLRAAWSCPLSRCVDAPPTVVVLSSGADDASYVIVGSQGGDVVCARVKDGRVAWRLRPEGRIEGGVAAVPRGKGRHALFVNSYLDEDDRERYETTHRGVVRAYEWRWGTEGDDDDAAHGPPSHPTSSPKLLWRRTVPGALKNAPVHLSRGELDHDLLVVAGHDGVVRLWNASDGEELCRCDEMGGPVQATPVAIVSSTATTLVVASRTGRVARLDVVDDSTALAARWSGDVGANVPTSPVVLSSEHHHHQQQRQRVVVCASNGTVRCLDVSDGREMWRNGDDFAVRVVAAGRGCLVSGGDRVLVVAALNGRVRGLRVDDGRTVWTTSVGAAVLGAPVRVGSGATVVVVDAAGRARAIDAADGRVAAGGDARLTSGEVWSSPTADDDGTSVLVGCRDDRLYKVWT